jgi:hypothetical protein
MRKATTIPSDDKLNSILAAYNAGSANDAEVLELELSVPEHRRAAADWEDTWSTLVMKAASDGEPTFYTDTRIYEDSASKKITRDYLVRVWNNNRKSDKMSQLVKKTLDGADYQGLTLRLSSEATYEAVPIGSRNMVRVRSRMTVIPKWAPNWKLDFTRSEVVPRGNGEALQSAYDSLFSKTPLTPVDFVNRAKTVSKTDIRQRLQLEMEWVGETLDLEELNTTANNFRNFLRGMASDTPYYKAIMWLAKHLNRKIPPQSSLKQLSVSVKSLTRRLYNDILESVSDWVITEKADGERAWLVIAPENFAENAKLVIYLLHHDLELLDWKIPKNVEQCILDGEWVNNKFYMFDAIEVNNKDVTNTTLTTRLEAAIPVAKALGIEIKSQVCLIDGSVIGIDENKKTGKTPTVSDTIKKVMNAKYKYKLDGLIFTRISSHYWGPEKPIKWKSPDQTTIDFLTVKAPEEALKSASYPPKKDHTLMFLFCGVRKSELQELKLTPFAYYQACVMGLNISKAPDAMIPIQFSPLQDSMAYVYYHPSSHVITAVQLHHHVGEYRYDLKTKTWHLERLRVDRDVDVIRGVGFGNKFTPTAVDVFQGIQDPFTFEELLKPRTEGVSYFQVDKDPRWRPITHYNNFVKSRVLMQLHKARWILDGCCGKGQDLLKYTSMQIPNIVMMDQDQAALNDIQPRIGWIHDPKQNKFGMKPPPPSYTPKIHVRKVNMSDFAKVPKELKSIPSAPDKIDAIVMNFCIHYFIDTSKSAHEFAKMASQMLDKNGLLIFTLFNGDIIRKIMKDYSKDETWEINEIYKIKLLQDLPEVLDFGYKIGVMHPFSNGQFIEEYLVPMRKLGVILEAAGFMKLQGGSFGDWMNSYNNMKDKQVLEKNDQIYSSLYHYYSYVKL